MNRRESLKRMMYATLALGLAPLLKACKDAPGKILIVSGWQDVNIGDIAHTPGLLTVLQTFLPNTKLVLWEKNVGQEVRSWLQKNFPKVEIIQGTVEKDGSVYQMEILESFKDCDLMIHGSGPSIVGQSNLEAWVKYTGKPFGIFGTTIEDVDDRLKSLLLKASFILTRETASIEVLKEAGIMGKHISFVPDATFFFHLHNDELAASFLKEKGLEKGKFICAVPRLRKTPYYLIKNRHKWTEEAIQRVEDLNNRYKEVDHAKLREALIAWVRGTGNKVLLCPEMTYEVDIMDELLYNPLPDDVKPFVEKRGYWLPDEAASVYARAFAVLSFECHSPIIAAANGVPFFYLRQPHDTIKGQMYYDLNFSDWIFEIEETTGKEIADRLQGMWRNYSEACNRVASEVKKIGDMYKVASRVVVDVLSC